MAEEKEEPNIEKLIVENYIQQKITSHEDIMESICHSFQMSKLEVYTIIERYEAGDPKNWGNIDFESPRDLQEDFLTKWISERGKKQNSYSLYERFIRWLTW